MDINEIIKIIKNSQYLGNTNKPGYVLTNSDYENIFTILNDYKTMKKELDIYRRFGNQIKFIVIDTLKMENTIPRLDIINLYHSLENNLFELKNNKEDNKQDG